MSILCVIIVTKGGCCCLDALWVLIIIVLIVCVSTLMFDPSVMNFSTVIKMNMTHYTLLYIDIIKVTAWIF